MNPDSPDNLQCEECGAILRELRDAWRAARMRFREAWVSSGRDHSDFVAALRSGDLSQELLDIQPWQTELSKACPADIAEAQFRKEKHEAETGHSVNKGWRKAGFRDLSDFI